MVAMSYLERIVNAFISYVLFLGMPVAFIVFLVLALVQIPKVKKKERRPTKLIVFGILSSVFLCGTAVEIFFIIMLAAAVAHM